MQTSALAHLLHRLDRCAGGIAAQPVRDLAWLLFAPDTLDPRHPDIAAFACPPAWLERVRPRWIEALLRLATDPAPLLAILDPPPRRLGLYAETLLGWWLAREPGFSMLHRHRPVAHQGRTLGDFDFILDNAELGVIHIELAVKFFLGIGAPYTLDRWVGVSLHDSLGIKWRKATQQQLRLGFHPAAQALLGRPPDRCWLWLKAWLFHPLDAAVTGTPALSAEHPRGVWGRAGTLLDHWGGAARCLPLRLLQRLSPARFPDDAGQERLDILLQRWREHTDGHPLLIVRLEPHTDGGWAEAERAYVVDEDWPAGDSAGLFPVK